MARNRTLGSICVGAEMGGEQIPDELKITQLRFGMSQSEQPHPCFGIEDQINPPKVEGVDE